MHKKLIVLLVVLALGVAVVAGAFFTGPAQVSPQSALTELNIGNMTCGSCVGKINAALEKLNGVGQIDISVTNGRGQMTYDPALTSSVEIAKVISGAGFPATVRLDMSAADYAKTLSENAQLSTLYVARIGNRLLSREDFTQAVELRAGSALAGKGASYANPQLQAQVWNEMKEREILLLAADKNKVVVQDNEVEFEIKQMKAANQDFTAAVLARFGTHERFFSQLKESMIINRNIEQHVVAGLKTDFEKQQRFSDWFQKTLQNTNVVIFDPTIKQAEAGGSSSCGGTCGSR